MLPQGSGDQGLDERSSAQTLTLSFLVHWRRCCRPRMRVFEHRDFLEKQLDGTVDHAFNYQLSLATCAERDSGNWALGGKAGMSCAQGAGLVQRMPGKVGQDGPRRSWRLVEASSGVIMIFTRHANLPSQKLGTDQRRETTMDRQFAGTTFRRSVRKTARGTGRSKLN